MDHPMGVDIEHVLPKSKYRQLAVTLVNLSVACKRCNMIIKRDRQDFIAGSLSFSDDADVCDPSRYLIVHPNVDDYEHNIQAIFIKVGSAFLRKYLNVNGTSKGSHTSDYFRFYELERDSLDEIQGIHGLSGTHRASLIKRLLGVE